MFWTNQANGNIVRRPAAGGAISPIGPASSTLPGYIAFGGGKLFWTSGFANAAGQAHLRVANIDGSGVATMSTYPAAVTTNLGQVATDATHVYWASAGYGVFRAAFGAATCTEGTDCTMVSTNGSGNGANGITVDDTFVYYTSTANGNVYRVPKAGGGSVVVATDQDMPTGIAVIGTTIYWANKGTTGATAGSIRKAPQVGAMCSGVACAEVAKATQPDALIAAADGLYWTDNVEAGGVYRLAK